MSYPSMTYVEQWRAPYWDADVPSRPAWLVSCPDHPELGTAHGEPWGYASVRNARAVRTKHWNTKHRGELR